MRILLAFLATFALCAPQAIGQSVEAKTNTQGPRGRGTSREVRVTRSPDSIQRSAQVRGPGGASASRQVTVQRRPAPPVDRQVRVAQAPAPRPVVINRQVNIQRNFVPGAWGYGPAFSPGGYSSFNLFFGSPPPPVVVPAPVVVAPPPVLVMPAEPVVEIPPPNIVVQEPQRYRTEPETIVVDPVANAIKRLYSHHDNSRRDGALTLARLGDARAVPKLIELARFDDDTDVRAAAAYALGEIGDPQAKATLQSVALYDRKQKVRNEAALAIGRLETPRAAPSEASLTKPLDSDTNPFETPNSQSQSRATPSPPLPALDPPADLFPEPLPTDAVKR